MERLGSAFLRKTQLGVEGDDEASNLLVCLLRLVPQMLNFIGRELVQMSLDSAPVAASTEIRPPCFLCGWNWFASPLGRVGGRSTVAAAELQGSDRCGGGQLAKTAGPRGPDAADWQA